MHAIDVSTNNVPAELQNASGGGLDWPALYQSVVALARANGDTDPPVAWIKVSEGINYINPRWQSDRAGAHAAGFEVGLYHFDRASEASGALQAAFFLHCIGQGGGIWQGEALAGDFEDTRVQPDADLGAEMTDFLMTLSRPLGMLIWRYSGEWYAAPHNLLKHVDLEHFPWWWADYGNNTDQPADPSPVDHILARQFTDTARLNGCATDIDVSRIYGGIDLWRKYAWPQPDPLAGRTATGTPDLDKSTAVLAVVKHVIAKLEQSPPDVPTAIADLAQLVDTNGLIGS